MIWVQSYVDTTLAKHKKEINMRERTNSYAYLHYDVLVDEIMVITFVYHLATQNFLTTRQ